MTPGPRRAQPCTTASCVAARNQLHQMLRILAPSLQPGGLPVDALNDLVAKARETAVQRDRYRQAYLRAARIAAEFRRRRQMIHPDDLGRALNGRGEGL